MDWFGAYIKFGGRLAPFALPPQFYFALGRIHSEDIYGPAEITLCAGISIVLPAAEVLRVLPAHQTLGHADELCPIGETNHFLGTSLAPEAPQITPLPLTWRLAVPLAPNAAATIEARHRPFQSRAPPVA